MGLTKLDPIKVPFLLGEREVYLRYNLTAQLCLEHYMGDNIDIFMMSESDNWGIDDVLHILRAGLIDCFFEENEEAINRRDFDAIKPSLATLGRYVDQSGIGEIVTSIVKAVMESLPQAPEGADENFTASAARG